MTIRSVTLARSRYGSIPRVKRGFMALVDSLCVLAKLYIDSANSFVISSFE